ncbi:MAG: amidohydrolase family protein [Alphaproteobacteria bacterium]|nr:amidohydrolase family protein [Alphaproteobacteria bacterium]
MLRVRPAGAIGPFLSLLLLACAPQGDGADKADTDTDTERDTDTLDTDGDPVTDVVTCPTVPTSTARCDVTNGDDRLWITATILAPDAAYAGGSVVLDATGAITCVGCDCDAAGATRIVCGDAVVSPGLINLHEHLTFAADGPVADDGERYEHRHEWRMDSAGHTPIVVPASPSAAAVQWSELRHLVAGTTSVAGSGGQAGLVRNLDRSTLLEGLDGDAVQLDTFPLGDSNGTRQTSGCAYGGITTAASVASVPAWLPHVAMGVDASAHHELACLTGADAGAEDVVDDRTALVGGVALQATDLGVLATRGAGIVWSPRSDLMLYGQTVPVTAALSLGVPVALGTDWYATGSANLLRELACATTYNAAQLHGALQAVDLWRMVTSVPADLAGRGDTLGRLAVGHIGDIAVFASTDPDPYASVVTNDPGGVVLVLRGGAPLYGDADVVDALHGSGTCEAVSACDVPHAVCLDALSTTLEDLRVAAGVTRSPFVCGVPDGEPTCHPYRPVSVDGSSAYDGEPTATDGDGDGVPDATDLCPDVFDPIRPMDGGAQADADGDGLGDACDPCPLVDPCP